MRGGGVEKEGEEGRGGTMRGGEGKSRRQERNVLSLLKMEVVTDPLLSPPVSSNPTNHTVDQINSTHQHSHEVIICLTAAEHEVKYLVSF